MKTINEKIKVFASETGKKDVEEQIKKKGGEILSITSTAEVIEIGFEQELLCTYNVYYRIKEQA